MFVNLGLVTRQDPKIQQNWPGGLRFIAQKTWKAQITRSRRKCHKK